MPPPHPRALLTLLEGAALWSGHPLSVALSAADASTCWLGSGLFGDELWPGESPLVRFTVAVPACRKRLSGLGDFKESNNAKMRPGVQRNVLVFAVGTNLRHM